MQRFNKARMGETLRQLRGDRAQAEIAGALGISAMAVSQYERGERIPNDEMKVKISNYFGKRVEDIFFIEK